MIGPTTLDDRGPQLAAVTVVLLALCWVSVSLRCYTMGFLLRRFYTEDWLAIFALIIYTAYSVFCLLGVRYGLGAHVSDVPLEDHPKALFYKWAGQVVYVIMAALVKFIAGLLLLRLCVGKRWQCITLWTLMIVSAVYTLFYVFIVIFQCQPVEFYWYRYDLSQPVTGKCNGKLLATIPTYISFVISVVSDWILALLPISIVWNAKMDKRSKISVSCVLALGSIASMATIARIPYAKQLLSNPDYLYNFTDLAIWSTVEIGLGLTASSLATLKPLFRKLKIIVVTKSGSHYTGTLPQYRSRASHSRGVSGSSHFQSPKNARKLQKSPPLRNEKLDAWRSSHPMRTFSQDTNPYEVSLATETGSVSTTITARASTDENHGAPPLSPPPPLHHRQHSYRSTSVSYQVSHVGVTGMESSNMI
ncbi:hypothetical protein JX265_005804 [Neoarthrinium moseri]|uniref:Rhodopsin domain-containing protein n=1 Tax=Neoarthrinium moseri TaxID=1658444 RepID=A0A9P9WNG5_9PEZI|nr:hypothetical protein JX265_005804 [Neoarthrinium moseri]